ncbi:hypothetical protein [Amycolatopsis sp. Poz14]|uniref:hypothetical protein n=1 Tax=Amycolatopsis sp. Poz14 TaxID=1447705 RepID=UPI001EE966BA|nr:hypothetical protein [Amycolatopsis sp. Poz14]MCG3749126.1 hypothetical protein [Amycolatopsis sp. Poz14]
MTKLSARGVRKIAPYAISVAGVMPTLFMGANVTTVVPVRSIGLSRVSHSLTIGTALASEADNESAPISSSGVGDRLASVARVIQRKKFNDAKEFDYEEDFDHPFRPESEWVEAVVEAEYAGGEVSFISLDSTDLDPEV